MMVKGVSKRIVVVRFPDTRMFEQALFIVREDAGVRTGVSADQIVDEACQVAESYVHKGARRRFPLSPLICLLTGAGATGLVWLVTALV